MTNVHADTLKWRLLEVMRCIRVPLPMPLREPASRLAQKIFPKRTIKFNIGPVPICIEPAHMWLYTFQVQWVGLFLKRPTPDVYNPRRWGGFFLGIEVGSRG